MKYLLSSVLVLFTSTQLFAQETATASPFDIGSFLPIMLIMFAVMYFLMIRPEQKKQKEKQALMNELKKGNNVLTIGGLYGTVSSVKDDVVIVKVADNTNLKISKTAISTVITSNKNDNDSKDSGKK